MSLDERKRDRETERDRKRAIRKKDSSSQV